MFDLEVVQRIGAEKGVHEIIIEKDYILELILWGISKIDNACNNWVFKGGTALHKMFFSDWRFSEDLDFTTMVSITESNYSA